MSLYCWKKEQSLAHSLKGSETRPRLQGFHQKKKFSYSRKRAEEGRAELETFLERRGKVGKSVDKIASRKRNTRVLTLIALYGAIER